MNTDTPPSAKKVPVARLKTIADARRYLARLVNETRAGKVDPQLAGKLGYLVNILIGCIKDTDIEERLAKLEAEVNGATE